MLQQLEITRQIGFGYLSGAPFISLVTRYNRKIIQLNTSFGYSDSLVIPCVSESGRGNALLILISPHVGTDDFTSLLISKSHRASCLCKAIDAVCVRKFRSSRLNIGIPKILKRERGADGLDLPRSDTEVVPHDLCWGTVTSHWRPLQLAGTWSLKLTNVCTGRVGHCSVLFD